jgi:hypothetical protein
MNLIQTQYHLRDLPNEQVKAFANGRDPSAVPEWLAAAEMQRRERVEMASSKAPDKSVKERLEETMGLKALQAQRQQMAGQKMGEQAMAMPTIPENVPQPEDQPEVQEAAAGGLMRGIAQLPVEMFHQAAYAGGGIVAFESGGKTARKLPKEEMAYYGLIADQENQSDAERQRLMLAEQAARERMGKPFYAAAGTSLVNSPTDKAPVSQSQSRSLKGASSIPDVPPPSSPAYEELMRRINEPEQEIETPEQLIEKRKALLEKQGVRPAGEGQERRIQERGVAYEQEKKDRALNNLIASMSSFSRPNIQGRGLGGDYANTAVQGFEAGRQEDAKFRDTQDKLRDAIEAQRRAELIGDVDTAQKANQEAIKLRAEMRRTTLTAAGQAAQTDITARGQGLQFLSDQERIAATREGNRIQAAQLAKDPDAIRGARALMKDAKDAGKDLTLEQALIIYGQASAGYQGKELTEERARLEKADKQFNELYGTQVKIANFEKDPAKKQKLLDDLEVKRKEIYKKYKVKDEDGVSSDQGGGSSGGTSSAGWGQATKVTK